MASFIQILAFISTILFYLSPYFWLIRLKLKKIEINEISCFVVICILIQATLSSVKIEEDNSILIWANLIGVISCFIWLLIFLYIFTEAKENIPKYLIFIFGIIDLIIEIYYIESDILNPDKKNEEGETDYLERKQYRKNLILLIRNLISAFMYISPGLNFFKFVFECNQRYICLPLEIIGSINSVIYLIMGCLMDHIKYDMLVMNIICILICLFFTVFYLVNVNKKIKPKLEPFIKEDFDQVIGTQKLPKRKTTKKRRSSKAKHQDDLLDFI